MIIPIIIVVGSIYFDGLLTNLLPYLENDLSLFTPMLTIVSLFLIYPFYRKKEKDYFIIIGVLGFIYDLLYTNLLFYDALVFLLFGYIIKKIYKNLDIRPLKISLYVTGLIILYELLLSFMILVFQLTPITISEILYKITHSILLNILYAEGIHFILKVLPKKWKRIDIN